MTVPQQSPPSLTAAAGHVLHGRADAAFRAWVAHVEGCTAECRTRGIDCDTAKTLRRELREARAALETP